MLYIELTQLEEKFDFQRNIKEMQVWYEIPVDLTSNFDQTPFPYICTGNCRYAKKQSSNVPLVKNGKKKFHNY